MTCTVCRHNDRASIDLALLDGVPLRQLAEQSGLKKDALLRHKAHHIPLALTKAKLVQEIADADNLLERLDSLYADAQRIKAECEKAKDNRTALAGVRQLTRIIELIAELRVQLNRTPQMNITLSSEWALIRTTITHALLPYPEAGQAVAKALIDASTTS